ncbi:hypothetical protein [Campylobacter devanensis]|uniref:hypothetical protein n=1 Tax=Campylobacter devanensis TaxID=3161138 RepID=UPI000A349756|nr:hypothetical protein [Campylobacter sp. P0107]
MEITLNFYSTNYIYQTSIAIVTTPFKFKNNEQIQLATKNINELKKMCDGVVVISNEKLSDITDSKADPKDNIESFDTILASAVNGISSIFLSHSEYDINIDFVDIITIMSSIECFLTGIGEAQGEKAAQEALKSAMQSHLLGGIDIKGTMGAIVNFTIHPDCPMSDIAEAMEIIEAVADPNADIFLGTKCDTTMPIDKVLVTLMVADFFDNVFKLQ